MGNEQLKYSKAKEDCLLTPHVEIIQSNLNSSTENRNTMLKCQKIKPSHPQQFSVIFQASEMYRKIQYSWVRGRPLMFHMTLVQHRPWNLTKLFLLLSTITCSENIFWKNILSLFKDFK